MTITEFHIVRFSKSQFQLLWIIDVVFYLNQFHQYSFNLIANFDNRPPTVNFIDVLFSIYMILSLIWINNVLYLNSNFGPITNNHIALYK